MAFKFNVFTSNFDLVDSAGAVIAANVSFDNIPSGLTATNVQDAIDELAAQQTYVHSFNATTDWGAESGGYYTITVPEATHDAGTNPILQVYEVVSGDLELVNVDRVLVDPSGDVSIRVLSSPDLRFAGVLYIANKVAGASGGGPATWGSIIGTLSDQTDLQTELNNKQDALVAGSDNQMFYQVSAGVIGSTDALSIVPEYGSLNYNKTVEPDNNTGQTIQNYNLNVEPLQNSPDENYTYRANNVNLDNADSGFTFGTSGRAITTISNNITHQGTGNVGEVNFLTNYVNLGNGTDPISVRGFSYAYGFGNINANVNINGPIQGYGFQPSFDPTVTLDTTLAYISAFYDNVDLSGITAGFYSSANFSPSIGGIDNNKNYSAININPTIDNFIGNASAIGLNLNGVFDTFDTGYFQGVNINPTINTITNATGININMSNVTGSNVKAMDITGDVYINGALTFSGALSIGQLQAFYASNPVDGGVNPQIMHGLTTSMTALNGVTTANADVIGVNNAMLIEMQANSINTSGPFKLGFAAVALPCAVETYTGSSLDYMNMAVYALNLSGASTGGTIDRVNGVRVEAIPNGITTINEFVAFEFDQLAGQVGTDVWGLHVVPTYAENFLGGSLAIGTSSEKVSNSSVGLEIGSLKAFLNAKLTTTERDALVAIDGMQIYNTTTNKLQVRSSGSWVDLH